MSVQILIGDCREVLRTLPDESVHCVVTSPPYWGLRDYGTTQWKGGNSNCDHRSPTMRDGRNENRPKLAGSEATNSAQLLLAHHTGCGKCGAVKVDTQLGLEPTYQEHIAVMVDVFREVRRVLRKDGTLWLNYGDSYAGAAGMTTGGSDFSQWKGGQTLNDRTKENKRPTGLKPKDLCGIPWRIAFALQADGWWLRQDIVWSKPNPMPESVTDRCTKSHEYIFLLTKSERYYFDNHAIAEECVQEIQRESAWESKARRISQEYCEQGNSGSVAQIPGRPSGPQKISSIQETQGSFEAILREREGQGGNRSISQNEKGQRKPVSGSSQEAGAHEIGDLRSNGRSMDGNPGIASVQVCSVPSTEAINAGPHNPPSGRRPTHGIQHSGSLSELQQPQEQQKTTRNRRSVWEIATAPFSEAHFATFPPALIEPCIKAGTSEKGCCAACGAPWVRKIKVEQIKLSGSTGQTHAPGAQNWEGYTDRTQKNVTTLGWSPSCSCLTPPDVVPCRVLDPFGGAGTTGLVADRLQRNAILIELNPTYAAMARRRIDGDAPLLSLIDNTASSALATSLEAAE